MNNRYILVTTFNDVELVLTRKLIKTKMANANYATGTIRDFLETEYKNYRGLVKSNPIDKAIIRKGMGYYHI